MALRIGIVGKRGLAFAAGFRASPECVLTAFCELDAEVLHREADEHGVPKRFARYEDLLGEVDAVVVATPMPCHAAQVILALEAGKHVMSEVTAAVTLDECWRIALAAERSDATYFMAENYLFFRSNVLVSELVKQGLFGELYYGEGEYLHEVRNYHHDAEGRPTWRYDWQVGTSGNTYGTHSLGPVMHWFQVADPDERVESVVCLGSGVHTDPEHPHEDTSITLRKLRSGKLVRLRLDMMSNRPHLPDYYSLQGTCGVYEAPRCGGDPKVWFGDSADGAHREWRSLWDFEEQLPAAWRDPDSPAFRTGHGGGDYFVVREFLEAILDHRTPVVDVFRALEWTAAGLCSQTSIAHGGVPIRVPDFRDATQRPVWIR
ncbi:MAG: Gfo/Idh/MocA family oxidoreductase [Fimbriimonadaceae bacterium]|nr:Gfo/Idh/MocA family oxidoreductase [Fimbriimonadaceae bacterium]